MHPLITAELARLRQQDLLRAAASIQPLARRRRVRPRRSAARQAAPARTSVAPAIACGAGRPDDCPRHPAVHAGLAGGRGRGD